MSSTGKTTHLQLNQWAASDGVLRTDFNADNQIIDSAFAALPFVRLRTCSLTTAAQILRCDLSDLDFSDYLELKFYTHLSNADATAATNVEVTLNNITTSVYYSCDVSGGSASNGSCLFYIPIDRNEFTGYSEITLSCTGKSPLLYAYTAGIYTYANSIATISSSQIQSAGIPYATLPMSSLTSIEFRNSYGNMAAGSSVSIFGLKK